MNTTNEVEIENSNSALESLKMNPFSFIQMSGSLNYLVYGLVLPAMIFGASLFTEIPQLMVIFGVVAGIMSLASIVRRGMDAGITPLTTIVSLILSSWLISVVLEKTLISFKILLMTGNLFAGMILLALIQNIYLVYLLFAPQKEMKETKENKIVKIIVYGVLAVLVLGILAAFALPRLQ